MKRVQFVVGGQHPLLLLVRDYLIRQGFELVAPESVDPDLPAFLVWGGEATEQVQHPTMPALLLSSSHVYSDRDHKLRLREIEPMDEADGHVITSPLDKRAGRVMRYLASEYAFLQRPGKTIVARVFNVYGPNVHHGVVHTFLEAARNQQPLRVHSPGRQVRTFLYEDDFLVCIRLLVRKLLRGGRGIYNVGSDEQIEILSLAKSVCHAQGISANIELVEDGVRGRWWVVPALDRIRAAVRWRAKVSLRSGLFRMVRG